MTDIPDDITAKAFPEREIFAYGRYLRCQILNWEHGDPLPYIVCNPLDRDYREQFLAAPSMGTWARVDLREVAQAYAALLSERTASEAALKEALTDRPGEMLDDEDLDTISACVRNDQHGRILGLELWELIRVYRAARAFLAKTGGA